MRITFELSDEDFPESQRTVVADNMNLQPRELEKALQRVARCATMEYLQMLFEKGMPSKADEVLQERLYYFIRHYYVDRLPTEAEIQTLFQITSTKSKSLLKNTRSRFRTSIEKQIQNTVRKVLETAKQTQNKYTLVIQSPNILDEMNEVISQHGPTLPKLTATRGKASMYDCPPDTLNLLKKVYGLFDS